MSRKHQELCFVLFCCAELCGAGLLYLIYKNALHAMLLQNGYGFLMILSQFLRSYTSHRGGSMRSAKLLFGILCTLFTLLGSMLAIDLLYYGNCLGIIILLMRSALIYIAWKK